jgi:adenylosuccinate lyase
MFKGKSGAVVHWGATPSDIARTVNELVIQWKSK